MQKHLNNIWLNWAMQNLSNMLQNTITHEAHPVTNLSFGNFFIYVLKRKEILRGEIKAAEWQHARRQGFLLVNPAMAVQISSDTLK